MRISDWSSDVCSSDLSSWSSDLSRRSGLRPRRQKTSCLAFEYEAGQPPRRVSAGIDADAVGPDLGFRRDGVAVHDDLAVVGVGLEKQLANPQHVFLPRSEERRVGKGWFRTGRYR